ncbi:hypothetical protein V2H45_23865 [Tumidithrix elongata RA019]|uniref:Uncharacterized protein n=1 Tax=Tumidithrix elongata BACA0141 TaxID=2716417 RepID=A0AAW9PW72_9CYAN|nr:hypothetical protein [Tumidithrix elongata RA019]
MENIEEIELVKLGKGLPAITLSFGATLAEACAICLEERGHSQGVEISIYGDFKATFKLYWQTITDQMLRCWNDREYTTEQAAYGIAFILVRNLTDFTVIERSRKGTGFDYWLGVEGEANELPFQNKVRLEVSGIREGDDRRVKSRVKQKVEQTKASDGTFPAYIVVVEFSKPLSFMVRK